MECTVQVGRHHCSQHREQSPTILQFRFYQPDIFLFLSVCHLLWSVSERWVVEYTLLQDGKLCTPCQSYSASLPSCHCHGSGETFNKLQHFLVLVLIGLVLNFGSSVSPQQALFTFWSNTSGLSSKMLFHSACVTPCNKSHSGLLLLCQCKSPHMFSYI